MSLSVPLGTCKPSRRKDFFTSLKRQISGDKNLMAFNSDIDRLTSDVNRLCRAVSPPRIDMIVWHEGEDPPETKPWQLRIMIERRG